MAFIDLICPNCRAAMRAPESLFGKRAKCPKCGATLTVPASPAGENRASPRPPEAAPAPAEAAADAPSQGPSESPRCPSCGTQLPAKAVLCVQCGLNLATGQRMTTHLGEGNRPKPSFCYLRHRFCSEKVFVRNSQGRLIARVRSEGNSLILEKGVDGPVAPWIVVRKTISPRPDGSPLFGLTLTDANGRPIGSMAEGRLETARHGLIAKYNSPDSPLGLVRTMFSPIDAKHKPKLVIGSPRGPDVELIGVSSGLSFEDCMTCDPTREDFDLCLLLCVLHQFGLPPDRLPSPDQFEDEQVLVYQYRITTTDAADPGNWRS